MNKEGNLEVYPNPFSLISAIVATEQTIINAGIINLYIVFQSSAIPIAYMSYKNIVYPLTDAVLLTLYCSTPQKQWRKDYD